MPESLQLQPGQGAAAALAELWNESEAYPNYEGRAGASARELKTVLDNAAQNEQWPCLTPRAVLEELANLIKDKSVYEFLQTEVIDGYHDPEAFLHAAEELLLDVLDDEVREAMGLVSERQYREAFERYVMHVLAWTRSEKLLNKVTGEYERPDEEMMAQTEGIVMVQGEDRREFRRALISAVGAHKLDHPDDALDYPQIFPDMFRRLRDHFFEERKRTLRKNAERVLRYLGDERAQLLAKEVAQVESALEAMKSRYGYCVECAKDALVLLLSKRYTD